MLSLIVVLLQLADQTVSVQGGNVSADVSAAMVQAKCVPASSANIVGTYVSTDNTSYHTINATLGNGCNVTTYSPVGSDGTWFGWVVTAPYQCVKGINPEDTTQAPNDNNVFYRPAAFSFFKNSTAYSVVFCYSSVLGYNVTASYSFNAPNNGISNVVNTTAPTSLGYGPNG